MIRRAALLERGLMLLLSILSLTPLILIGFSSAPPQDDPGRGAVIAPAYVAICVLGLAAAFNPIACSRLPNLLNRRGDTVSVNRGLLGSLGSSRGLLSHHLRCGGFQSHEFNLAGRSLCVGCTGMVVGALSSSLLVIAYFSQDWSLIGIVHGILVLGVLLVALELTKTLLWDVERQVPRFFLNVFFIVGVSLILIGEDVLRKSLLVDSYLLVLSFLWLYIRIRSSQLSHQRICAKCRLVCPIDERQSLSKNIKNYVQS